VTAEAPSGSLFLFAISQLLGFDMKFVLFSILDTVANVYLVPFPARTVTDAKRQLLLSKDDPAMAGKTVVTKPGYFRLVELGHFDDETGDIQATAFPINHGLISDIFARGASSTAPS